MLLTHLPQEGKKAPSQPRRSNGSMNPFSFKIINIMTTLIFATCTSRSTVQSSHSFSFVGNVAKRSGRYHHRSGMRKFTNVCLSRPSLSHASLMIGNNHNIGSKKHSWIPSLLSSSSSSSSSSRLFSQENGNFQKEETLFALSSGGGGSTATAVAVIRITGPEAHDALQMLLSKTERASYKDVKLPKPRFASLRNLYDPPNNDSTKGGDDDDDDDDNVEQSKNMNRIEIGKRRDPLDSSLVLLFNSPSSFTGQDMVEIHSHGSRAVVQGVLSALERLSQPPYNLNLRPADRGEFTQRAYGSGKLGLVEVEALADLIVADTSYQRLQALRQLDGRLSRLYEGWRAELIKGLAHAEAVIDFGDDEDLDDDGGTGEGEMHVWGAIRPKMEDLRKKMDRHLADAQRGEILRDGVRVAICGPPNAGKSSFLNLLANREAAIVSPIAGTTRDVIEVTLDLGGVRCIVSDTAGVREDSSTGDIIEIEGMKRARKAALDAHVLVCMVDANEKQSGFTAIKEVFDDTLETNVLLLYNKIDLLGTQTNQSETSEQIDNILLGKAKSFEISCENNDGVDEFIDVLTQKVISRVSSESVDDDEVIEEDSTVITRARHRQHVTGASEALHRFQMRSSEGYMSLDLAAEELRLAASELGRITGAVDVEDVLDVLFSDFCIGK